MLREANLYQMCVAIRTFKLQLHAKIFRLWRANVRYRLFAATRRQLAAQTVQTAAPSCWRSA